MLPCSTIYFTTHCLFKVRPTPAATLRRCVVIYIYIYYYTASLQVTATPREDSTLVSICRYLRPIQWGGGGGAHSGGGAECRQSNASDAPLGGSGRSIHSRHRNCMVVSYFTYPTDTVGLRGGWGVTVSVSCFSVSRYSGGGCPWEWWRVTGWGAGIELVGGRGRAEDVW